MSWQLFVVLALASWRTFMLVSEDTILDRPRAFACRHAGERLELFIDCPYCAGFWIAVGWAGAWLAFGDDVAYAAVPFALSGIVAYMHTVLNVIRGE